MKPWIIFCVLITSQDIVFSQYPDTVLLHYTQSKGDTMIFKRMIDFDKNKNLYLVRDFYENGQIQMKASYSSINLYFKEEYQCNYRTNTKDGSYKEWFKNGQIKYDRIFRNGLRNGRCSEWCVNGQRQSQEFWKNGKLNGREWFRPKGFLYCFGTSHKLPAFPS
jgi:antitoxin component YwqK of YwqJK toxin-antitoxin module